MFIHSAMTHPPFLCTAWNKAVADSPPAVQEMSVSYLPCRVRKEKMTDGRGKEQGNNEGGTEVGKKYEPLLYMLLCVKMENFS